jgi:hypothetical protein
MRYECRKEMKQFDSEGQWPLSADRMFAILGHSSLFCGSVVACITHYAVTRIRLSSLVGGNSIEVSVSCVKRTHVDVICIFHLQIICLFRLV